MKKILLRSAVLALLPAIAFADPASNVRQLTDLHNQVAILTQQLAVARLQAQIAQQGAGASPTSPAGASAPGTPSPSAPAPIVPTAAPLPTIISIVGNGIHLTATLLSQAETELVVVPGQALPGGLTVYSITENGVNVMQAGNIVPLPFAGANSSTASSSAVPTELNSLPRIIPSPPPIMPSMILPHLPGSN